MQLLFGSSYRTLSAMNSNLFGAPLLSIGISSVEQKRFMFHHLVVTVAAQIIPFGAIQFWTVFHLDLATTAGVIAFILTAINGAVSTVEAVDYILNPKLNESPFTVSLSWTPKGTASGSGEGDGVDLDPWTRCGRRNALAKALTLMMTDEGRGIAVRFEISATERAESGCLLFGTMVSNDMDGAGGLFTGFMRREQQIGEAVMEALGLSPLYDETFDFKVIVSGRDEAQYQEAADEDVALCCLYFHGV